MNSKIIFKIALLALISLSSCANTPTIPEGEFLVEGTLASCKDSTNIKFYLLDDDSKLKATFDVPVVDNKFSFNGTVPADGARYVVNLYGDKFIYLYRTLHLEPQTYVTIEADMQRKPPLTIKSNFKGQKLLDDIAMINKDYTKQILGVSNLIKDTYDKISVDRHISSEAYKASKDELDYYSKLVQSLMVASYLNSLNYIKNKEVDKIWLYIFESTSKILEKKEVDPLLRSTLGQMYNELPLEYHQSEKGKAIGKLINPPKVVEVGQPMVSSPLYDVDGNEHSLSEFDGRYILLRFWSIGSAPYISSLKETQQVAEKYASRLSIVSISQDDENDWKSFVAEKKLEGNYWNELNENKLLSKSYGVDGVGVPSFVLISPTGIVMVKWVGYYDGMIEDYVFRYLGE